LVDEPTGVGASQHDDIRTNALENVGERRSLARCECAHQDDVLASCDPTDGVSQTVSHG
jgi:hypothetical protein